MADYKPQNVPVNPDALPEFLRGELQRLAEAINTPSDLRRFAQNYVDPDKPRDGDVRYADGVNWTPEGPDSNCGKGFYWYDEAAQDWIFFAQGCDAGLPCVWESVTMAEDFTVTDANTWTQVTTLTSSEMQGGKFDASAVVVIEGGSTNALLKVTTRLTRWYYNTEEESYTYDHIVAGEQWVPAIVDEKGVCTITLAAIVVMYDLTGLPFTQGLQIDVYTNQANTLVKALTPTTSTNASRLDSHLFCNESAPPPE